MVFDVTTVRTERTTSEHTQCPYENRTARAGVREEAASLGAGEIIVNAIDRDGTMKATIDAREGHRETAPAGDDAWRRRIAHRYWG